MKVTMRYSTRLRLIAGIVGVVSLAGVVLLLVESRIICPPVCGEAASVSRDVPDVHCGIHRKNMAPFPDVITHDAHIRVALATGEDHLRASWRHIGDMQGTRGNVTSADIGNRPVALILVVILSGLIIAAGLWYVIARRIMRPVVRLIDASRQVALGNMAPDIGPPAKGRIGLLQEAFVDMVQSLEERYRRRRAESENRLLISEKHASVGRLAAGVAHEINNPLTGVLTYAYMLLRRKDIDTGVREYLEVIVKSTERVRKIVKELLDFSKETKLDREVTDLNHLVHSAIAMMENQALLKGVSLLFNAGEDLPELYVDRTQLQGVLLNMIINAIDATDPGERVTISTTLIRSGNETGEEGVQIAVEDTGCGIPSEHLNKLFDPFFTTKEVGHGTGLGLAVSLGVVQRHGGTIRVESDVGRGSTFYIWMPVGGRYEE